MEHVALTGIAENVMRELKNDTLRTIEIRSPHNFFTVLKLNVGDFVFLTHTSIQDLAPGTTGVVARIMKHHISTHRTFSSTETFYEESETTMARIQLDPRAWARVRKVYSNDIGEITRVEAELISCYKAR
ncbi:MAG: DUF473 domain-containing protein [Methanohalobium sp.]|uniref:DUF473 domain-containing protein n=1 Tax=Methanohalobium sp. TaxID=2837493 RepID=UPI00397D15EA